MIRTARSTPTRDGGYLLSTYEGCTALYKGPLEGESVYVVGRNTPDEKLFKRNMLAEATDYTIEHKASIENIRSSACAGRRSPTFTRLREEHQQHHQHDHSVEDPDAARPPGQSHC
jgi:hypothetical protein